MKKSSRICSKGHAYYKSSDCPTCPVCERERKSNEGFMTMLSAPARRALENKGIRTLEQLSAYSEKEILKFHGIGKTSIPILKTALKLKGLKLKSD